MSDVFVSYARSTEKQAQAVVEALRALGYSVWIDDQLPAHRNYSHVIEEELDRAKAVLVVWSAEAARSDWVMDEAERAREQHKLVQVSLDKARLPMPFGRIQCVDLSGWTGDLDAPGWRKALAGIADLTGGSRPAAAPPRAHAVAAMEPLLAVLAFDNLSGDPEMAYFSDGVSEEILQTVAKAERLRVIGRASSFQFRGREKACRQVAAELGCSHVLDGSVRRSGSRVRITAHLVECGGQSTLWSDRFDRDLTDIFALQDEIAAAVATALKTAFAPRLAVGKIDPVAYDLFLRARLTNDSSERVASIGTLERVVKLAPLLAPAWSALALVRATHAREMPGDPLVKATRAAAKDAAETALRLDPSSGMAFAALGLLQPHGAYAARGELLERAAAVAPDDPQTLEEIGWFLPIVGRNEEALRFASRSLSLDPLNYTTAILHAMLLGFVGRYDDCQQAFALYREKWPVVDLAPALLYSAFKRDWPTFDRLSLDVETLGLNKDSELQAVSVGLMLRDRTPTSAQSVLQIGQSLIEQSGTVEFGWLVVGCAMGLTEETFALVERASFAHLFDEGGPLPAASFSPGIIFDRTANQAMMQDVRFVGFCAKLGLCDYWLQSDCWPDCADDGLLPYNFKAECKRLAAA
jgi:adenylate cyclase